MLRLLAGLGLVLGLAFWMRVAGLAPATLPDPEVMPAAALEEVAGGARELDLRPLWDNFPPSWQADILWMVETLRAHQDPEMWDLGISVLEGAVELFALPADAAAGMDHSERLGALLGLEPGDELFAGRMTEERWRVAAALQSIVASPFADPSNMGRLDARMVRELFGIYLPDVELEFRKLAGPEAELLGPTLRGALDELVAQARVARSEEPEKAEFTVEWHSTTYDRAMTSHVRLVQIEERWVPDVVADVVPGKLAEAKAAVADYVSQGAGGAPSELPREVLTLVRDGLGELRAAAGDVAAFDAALDTLQAKVTAAIVGHRMRAFFE